MHIHYSELQGLFFGNELFPRAENTEDYYTDGACLGSAIGIINQKGELTLLEKVDRKDNTIGLLLVMDADDATPPAQLYSAGVKYPS